MKIYISADIEGIAGITSWDEANPQKPDYAALRDRMTRHVAAACEGAVAGGAEEILVKDAHADGRNVVPEKLPRCARLVRGWSEHPFFMVQELDRTFSAAAMIGYHSGASSGANPLAHTLSSSRVARLALNDEPMTEFHLYGYACALHDVPVVLVSGDEALCRTAEQVNPAITTVPVMQGIGASTVSIHPDEAADRIREGMTTAVKADRDACRVTLPEHFALEVRFKEAALAYRAAFYPGARSRDAHTVALETDDYFEVLRALVFIV